MPSEVSCIPYSWGLRWIGSDHSVSQPGSGGVSPPPSEPRCGSSWGTPHARCNPEDAHILHIYILYKDAVIYGGAGLSSSLQTEKENHTDQVHASPQLPLQSCCLVVDFHLIMPPAVLYGREFTSRLFPSTLMASPVVMTDCYFFIVWEVSELYFKTLSHRITNSMMMPCSYCAFHSWR